jgi:hypothetical protein
LSVVAEALPLAALLARPDIRRGDSLARVASPSVPTGFPRLDAELPGGGWPAGSLTELVPAHDGIGELRILGPALARLARAGERLAWIAPPYLPYAPALAAAGIALGQVLIVRALGARRAMGGRAGVALRRLRRSARLAGRGEVPGAPAPAARSREHAGDDDALPRAAGCHRGVAGGAAARARYRRRRPRGADPQAPRRGLRAADSDRPGSSPCSNG